MWNVASVRVLALACLGALAAMGCGAGDSGGGPAFRVAVPSSAQVDALYQAQGAIDGGRRASMNPRLDAGVVGIASDSGWTAALDRAYTGLRLGFDHDLSGSGAPESFESLAVDGQGVIIWWRGEDCRIAWRQGNVTRLVVATCDQPGGVGCVYENGAVECRHCDEERCGVCSWADGEARCEAVPGPEPVAPEPEPDVAAPDVEEDAGTDEGGMPDIVEDPMDGSPVEDTSEPTPDVPVGSDTSGGQPTAEPECAASCLEERGGSCCLGCGCAAAGDCVPVCEGGYEWDCALGCCYNYDLFACACVFPARWDAEQDCCAVDGRCSE